MKLLLVPFLFLLSFGVCVETSYAEGAQGQLPVEITPLGPGWSGGECGPFSLAIADRMISAGVSESSLNFIKSSSLGGPGHGFLLYQDSNGGQYLIDGTFSQFNGGRGSARGTNVASVLSKTPEGLRVYRGLNDRGFVRVQEGTIEAYTAAITNGKTRLSFDALRASDANMVVSLGPQENRELEAFRQRGLDSSENYADRHVKHRTTNFHDPIVNSANLIGPSCAPAAPRPTSFSFNRVKTELFNFGAGTQVRNGFAMGVLGAALKDAGVDPRLTFTGTTAVGTYGVYQAFRGKIPNAGLKAGGNFIGGMAGGIGAQKLAEMGGGNANQQEAAGVFGSFAGGFAGGPHAGIVGGVCQVASLAGEGCYEVGKGTMKYGSEYWKNMWATGYFTSTRKCYFGR